MFIFAVGNGICEAVANPLVAALFPKNRTHYLNILHAGWPAGLVIGALASYFLAGQVRWEIQMSLFLIPVLIYGLMCLGQRFPKSEASIHGVPTRTHGGGSGHDRRVRALCGHFWFKQICEQLQVNPIFGVVAAGVLWLAISADWRSLRPARFYSRYSCASTRCWATWSWARTVGSRTSPGTSLPARRMGFCCLSTRTS